ncbi:hypothetical protein DIPPA_00041 [Diplonema papillatum]|nr:hypothetical protein DIPPA_00041 [Diplonema papillatum]
MTSTFRGSNHGEKNRCSSSSSKKYEHMPQVRMKKFSSIRALDLNRFCAKSPLQ